MFKESLFEKRVLFVGIPDMAYICLEGLHMSGVKIVGVIGAKKSHPSYSNFRSFVKKHDLNFIEYENLDDAIFIKKIRDIRADIAIVCSFNYKIPKIMLDSVKDGFINVHPSLLPKYRGPNPYSAAIINNEKETGVTLHYMDESFDTGDIIVQKKIAITPMETMGTLFNRTNILAFNMLLETLKLYEEEDLPREKQPDGDFIKSEFIGDDLFSIDYKKTAREIERTVRALNPFIIAATNFRRTLTKVFSSEVVDKKTTSEPGTIVKVDDDRFYIATAEGQIAPTVLQFGSFFIGTSKDFIKILNPKVGEKFE